MFTFWLMHRSYTLSTGLGPVASTPLKNRQRNGGFGAVSGETAPP